VKKSDMEKLAKATGGKIVTSIDDLTPEHLGEAGIVEEVKIGEDKIVYVKECKHPKAVSVVIRGGSEHVVDEAERALHDALCVVRDVLEDGKYVAGGGAPEIEVARKLREYAQQVGGREQLAIEAFADAIEVIPKTLAENAGHDPLDIIVQLREKHAKPDGVWYGIDVFEGKVSNMLELGILEPLRVKKQAIRSASEAAQMILRIDDIIAAKPTEPKGKGPGVGEGMPEY
jgi:chaperonin GroEL (HSP60 family)